MASTVYEMSTGVPMVASDQRAVFRAPYGHTSLWPAHNMDVGEEDRA